MTTQNKPDEKGYKPGANMPDGEYDPKKEGMAPSGNHASGNPANDVISNNRQQERQQPAQTEHNLQQGNANRTDLHNKQSAATASAEATHRDRSAGARGDDNTHQNKDSK